jgi:hypothetical protein
MNISVLSHAMTRENYLIIKCLFRSWAYPTNSVRIRLIWQKVIICSGGRFPRLMNQFLVLHVILWKDMRRNLGSILKTIYSHFYLLLFYARFVALQSLSLLQLTRVGDLFSESRRKFLQLHYLDAMFWIRSSDFWIRT